MYFLGEFDDEFLSEEEEEEALDEMVITLGEVILEDNNRTSILNIENVKKVMYVYHLMKHLLKGTNIKVEWQLNEPFIGMGSVIVIGKRIAIKNVDYFIKATKLASNYDVFVRTDKSVEMDFTFYGLTISEEVW